MEVKSDDGGKKEALAQLAIWLVLLVTTGIYILAFLARGWPDQRHCY
jgi:hypothetical protein